MTRQGVKTDDYVHLAPYIIFSNENQICINSLVFHAYATHGLTSPVHCLLQTLPLYAVTHERLGVLGTREYALRLLKTPDVTKGYYAVVEAARRGDLFKHGTV